MKLVTRSCMLAWLVCISMATPSLARADEPIKDASPKDASTEYEPTDDDRLLAHRLLSTLETEQQQGIADLRRRLRESKDPKRLMVNVVKALRAWANDPLRLAFDYELPFLRAERWRHAVFDEPPPGAHPPVEPADPSPKGESPSTHSRTSSHPLPVGTLDIESPPSAQDGTEEDTDRREYQFYQLSDALLKVLSEPFLPVKEDATGIGVVGVVLATPARHQAIRSQIGLSFGPLSNLLERADESSSSTPRIEESSFLAHPPSKETMLRESGPDWNTLYPQVAGSFQIQASMFAVPRGSVEPFVRKYDATVLAGEAVHGGTRESAAMWNGHAARLPNAKRLFLNRAKTLKGGRPHTFQPARVIQYNRDIRKTLAGAWTIVTGELSAGHSVRVQVVEAREASLQVRVRLRHCHVPTPIPSVRVRPSPSARPLKLHQPQWVSNERERDVELPAAGGAVLCLWPSLDPVHSSESIIVVLSVGTSPSPSRR